uniref:Uncharacterized protein n=1 Tax=Amorphochlora amoebiformis TaxID=1561963 RepID=A0A7S0H773_9EUKA|mmetsp:Transcript_9203/g.14556  ORF Transcript_9203/g.14556 Transcript_9203/m.14556 type:complete len:399 (+) Transcript_9203:120-1316(+)
MFPIVNRSRKENVGGEWSGPRNVKPKGYRGRPNSPWKRDPNLPWLDGPNPSREEWLLPPKGTYIRESLDRSDKKEKMTIMDKVFQNHWYGRQGRRRTIVDNFRLFNHENYPAIVNESKKYYHDAPSHPFHFMSERMEFVIDSEGEGPVARYDFKENRKLGPDEGPDGGVKNTDFSRWTNKGFALFNDTKPPKARPFAQGVALRPDWYKYNEADFERGDMPPDLLFLNYRLKIGRAREKMEQRKEYEKKSNKPQWSLKYCPKHGEPLDIKINTTSAADKRRLLFYICRRDKCKYKYYLDINELEGGYQWRKLTHYYSDPRRYEASISIDSEAGDKLYDLNYWESDPIIKRKCKNCSCSAYRQLHKRVSRLPKAGYVEFFQCLECGAKDKKVNRYSMEVL